jgi:hypothetical protein
VPKTLYITEYQRDAITVGQPADLFVDHRSKLCTLQLLPRRTRLRGSNALLDAAPASNARPLFLGDPDGDSIDPVRERFVSAKRLCLSDQDQEGCLECVIGGRFVVQDAPADSQDHRPVATNQDPKGRLAPVLPRQKL